MIKKTKFERACFQNQELIDTNKAIAASINYKVDHLCCKRPKAAAAAAAQEQRDELRLQPNLKEEDKVDPKPIYDQKSEFNAWFEDDELDKSFNMINQPFQMVNK